MSDDLNTEIKIGADASGVEAGVSKAKRSLKDLGDSAVRAGKDAGAGIGAIGAGGDKAAKDVERATKNIQGQLQRAIASFEAGEKGSRKFYESLASQRGADVSTLKPLLDQLDAYKGKADAAAQASVKASTSFTGLGAAAGLAARAVAAIGITASVGEFIRMADASTNVASRLGLVTSSAAELASVQNRLFDVAQKSRVSFVDLVGTYSQMARSTKELGVSQGALLGVVETISQAVTISGGSAASAQAALVQLSQGFASGALRGDELNSILEQTPRLAQAMADGLGVGVGKLRELGAAGELTAEKVLGALEKSASNVQAEFNKMAVTVEQASTQAANSALKLVGALDKITGASSATASGISRLSLGMDGLTTNIERLSAAKGLSDFFFVAFNNNQSLNKELAISQKELVALEARLERAPSNIYTRSAVVEMRAYVAEIKEAQARLNILSGSSIKDPRDQSGYTGRGQSYANEAKRQAGLAEDLNKFRLNLAGIPASYTKDMAELIRLNQAGVLVGKEYNDALKQQQDTLFKKTGVVKASGAAASQEQNAYASLVSSISQKIEAEKLELSGGDKLTASQRERIKLDADMAAGRVKLTASQLASVRASLDMLSGIEAQNSAAKEAIKIAQALEATRNKEAMAAAASVQGLNDKAQVLEDEAAAYGKTGAELQALTIARLQDNKAIVSGFDNASDRVAQIDAEIAALTRLGAATDAVSLKKLSGVNDEALINAKELARLYQSEASMAVLTTTQRKLVTEQRKIELDYAKKLAAVDKSAGDEEYKAQERAKLSQAKQIEMSQAAAQAQDEAWASMWDSVDQTAHDTFVNVANEGMDAFKRIGKTLKSAVLDMLYQMTIKRWIIQIAGSLSGSMVGGVAQAATGGSGAMGMAGNAASLFGAGASAFGVGASYGTASLFANGLTGTLAAGGQMIGAGSIMSGVGTIAGALGPIALGLAAVYAIVKKFDNSGTLHMGAGSIYSAGSVSGGADLYGQAAFGMGAKGEYNAAAQANTDSIARSIGMSLDSVAVSFGKKAGYEIATAFADDSSKDGAWGSLRISKDGSDLLNWEDTRKSKWAPKEFADGDAGYKQYLAAVAKDTRQVLLDMDLPSWADTLLESIGDAADMDALSQAVAQIGAIQTTFVQLGQTIDGFAGMGDKAFEALMKASGGFEALAQNAGAYYEAFYTEEERMAKMTAQLTEELAKSGVAMPATKDAYRALVTEQLNAGEAGQELAAKLLQLSPAFAQVADYEEALAEQAARAQEEVWGKLRTEAQSLGIALMRALGDGAGAAAAERALTVDGMTAEQAAMHDSNRALQDRIKLIERESALMARVPGVEDKYRTPEQRTAAQYDGIAASLTGAGVSGMQQGELSAALVGASKDEIFALASEIWNLGGLSVEAREALLGAVDALAGLKDAALQQRQGLEGQILQMTGNTQALREREIAALDPSNRALQALIYTLGDLQAAADEAAQKMAQAWSDWGTAAGMALQYAGDTSGMEARAAVLRAQLGGADKVDVGRLQELIGAEQALFEQGRKASEEAIAVQEKARQARISGLQEELSAAKALLAAAQRLGEYAQSLMMSEASGLSESDRMQALGGEYDRLKGLARGGDADAIGKLQGVAGDYLTLASTLAVSGSDYAVTAGRMAAELGQLGKAQELTAKSMASGYELQITELTAQTALAQEQFEVSSFVKGLIQKSILEQAEIWDRENTQQENLLALQDKAAVALANMPADFGKTMSPLLYGMASNIERPISSRLDLLISKMGGDAVKVPAFAVGTNVVPRTMLAQIHEGEAIIPKAFNPWAGGSMGGGAGNAELIAEVRALREQNARLEGRLASIEENTRQFAEQFDNVSAGGNALAVEAMA